VGVNHGLHLVLRLDSLEIIGACLSSKEERVLYEINRAKRYRRICDESRRLNVRNKGVSVNGVKATKGKKSGKRKRCVANRKCSENREVIGWCAVGRREIRCMERVRGGNY